jgi:hypothetical protein
LKFYKVVLLTWLESKVWLNPHGDSESGHRAATFYTLIANCHRAGINTEAYLTDLFERLPSATTKTVHELTPHAVAAKRRAAVEAAAEEKTVTERSIVTA